MLFIYFFFVLNIVEQIWTNWTIKFNIEKGWNFEAEDIQHFLRGEIHVVNRIHALNDYVWCNFLTMMILRITRRWNPQILMYKLQCPFYNVGLHRPLHCILGGFCPQLYRFRKIVTIHTQWKFQMTFFLIKKSCKNLILYENMACWTEVFWQPAGFINIFVMHDFTLWIGKMWEI